MGQKYLAIDFGGSSGRGMLGEFDGNQLYLTEIHRFPNYYVSLGNEDIWDIPWLYQQMLNSLKRALSAVGTEGLCSLGVDAWGTDYGLTDQNGNLLGQVRCTRNSRGTGMKIVQAQVDSRQLFRRTGAQSMRGNTLYQLVERKQEQDPALENARHLLMLPDLFSFF